MPKVADVLIDMLALAGVQRIYGVVGDSLNGINNPNFAKLAESAQVRGFRIERPEQLHPSLREAFAHDGPALVEVMVNRQELAMPPTITTDHALGFSLFMIRAVMSGKGDELVDLVKTNLFR